MTEPGDREKEKNKSGRESKEKGFFSISGLLEGVKERKKSHPRERP